MDATREDTGRGGIDDKVPLKVGVTLLLAVRVAGNAVLVRAKGREPHTRDRHLRTQPRMHVSCSVYVMYTCPFPAISGL